MSFLRNMTIRKLLLMVLTLFLLLWGGGGCGVVYALCP